MSRRKLPANEEVFRTIVKERLSDSFDTTEALLLTDVLLRIEDGIQEKL